MTSNGASSAEPTEFPDRLSAHTKGHNDTGTTARISREPLEQGVHISSLPAWSSMPVPLKVGKSLPKT